MHDELQDSRAGKLIPTLSDALVTQHRSGPPSHLKTEQLSRCPQAFHNEQRRNSVDRMAESRFVALRNANERVYHVRS
jgi:hypothetical protein